MSAAASRIISRASASTGSGLSPRKALTEFKQRQAGQAEGNVAGAQDEDEESNVSGRFHKRIARRALLG